MGDLGSAPGSGRSPGEENGYPLQHSCLKNSMDREAWQATVNEITKSQTQLSDTYLIIVITVNTYTSVYDKKGTFLTTWHISQSSHQNPTRWVFHYPHFMDEETEAQKVICSRPPGQ